MSNEIICDMKLSSNERDTIDAVHSMLTDGEYFEHDGSNYKLDGSIERFERLDDLTANIKFLVRGSLHSRMGDDCRMLREDTLPYNGVDVKYLSIRELMELMPSIQNIEIGGKNENYLLYEEIIAERDEIDKYGEIRYSEMTSNLIDFICLDCLADYTKRLIEDYNLQKIEPHSPQAVELLDFYQFHSSEKDAVCDINEKHKNTIEGCWKPSMDVLDIMMRAVEVQLKANGLLEKYKTANEKVREGLLNHDTLVQMLRNEIICM